MSRKKSRTNKTERELILRLHNQCQSLRQISKIVNRAHSTVKDMIDRYNESKINIFGSDGRRFVWRKANTEPKNLQLTVKYGGDTVMVWGCISAQGDGNLYFINEIMNQDIYLNILKTNLVANAVKMGIKDDFVFTQDNDPKYNAKKVKAWLSWLTMFPIFN
ncbi:Transposase IS30-like HTH domain [Cinara cedri]|uniref:Transposase IS30-like HTH domain n=1 Tax=Cinara cedri TaxID=506608 RepID=A0A5E4MK43_9HEMI|nr:Transposase IS30-like HTH domain [Cinara cedri]